MYPPGLPPHDRCFMNAESRGHLGAVQPRTLPRYEQPHSHRIQIIVPVRRQEPPFLVAVPLSAYTLQFTPAQKIYLRHHDMIPI